jgi:hypothetical protein
VTLAHREHGRRKLIMAMARLGPRAAGTAG